MERRNRKPTVGPFFWVRRLPHGEEPRQAVARGEPNSSDSAPRLSRGKDNGWSVRRGIPRLGLLTSSPSPGGGLARLDRELSFRDDDDARILDVVRGSTDGGLVEVGVSGPLVFEPERGSATTLVITKERRS